MEYNEKNAPVSTALTYPNLGTNGDYVLKIERVKKEAKQEGQAIPFIKLFCKSDGKCGV